MSDFVVKALINGVEKKLDLFGNVEPVATIEGVAYYHKLETKDLDKNNRYYDLDGNAYSSEPNLPFIRQLDRGNISWQLQSSEQGFTSCTINISNENANAGEQPIEGVQTVSETIQFDTLYAEYFTAGYLVINEDNSGTFYYNLVGDGEVTGPVSNEKFNKAISTLDAAKQDKLNQSETVGINGNSLFVRNVFANLKVVNLNTEDITYNELETKFPNLNMGIFDRIKQGSRSKFLFVKSSQENNKLVYLFYLGTTTNNSFNIQVANATNKETTGLLSIAQSLAVLPSLPSGSSTKTYVLKAVNGTFTWVEETAQ